MPCWEVNRVSVEFKAEQEHLLKKAAVALNWEFSKSGSRVQVGPVVIQGERASARAQESINVLKRAYSFEVVKAAAKSKGWAGSWSGSVTSNKLQASFKKF